MAHHYRRFVLGFLFISSLLSIAIITFNWVVDPFQKFDVARIRGFNHFKTEAGVQDRLFKSVEIARLKPKILFLGSSRVMAGLDPAGLAPFSQETAYNSAFAGANFEELYAYFEHALFHQPDLKMVVIGLDFFAFNKNKKDESDLTTLNLKKPSLSLECCNTLLFTKSITINSLNTVKKNMFGNPVPVFLHNGVYNFEFINDPSTNQILIMGEAEYMRQLLNSKLWYKDYEICEKRLGLFKKMTELCDEKGITLHTFINPCKAIYWDKLIQGNLWNQVEAWKKRLTAYHPIWDFSGFNRITTDQSQPSLYFDCSHYKPSVGNLILASFFDQPSFGYKLTPVTVDQSLQEIRDDYNVWKKNEKMARSE